MNLKENEKQAFVILFIKTFFGVYSLNLLCNKFLPQMSYNFDFLSEMFSQSAQYIQTSGVFGGMMQFLDDTADMWLTFMFTISAFIFAFSYLTEADFLKNRIKYADTTPLGILSCVMCFYPFTLITERLFPVNMRELVPIEDLYLRIAVYIFAILVNFISMFAILRLGTKAGNLTNRGIITGFPYNIVRHPDYAMQICYVILTFVPLYAAGELNILGNIVLTVGMILWMGVYGRGDRMKIESDTVEITSGVRFGKTLGSPITLSVKNRDFENWQKIMSVSPNDQTDDKAFSVYRPGHADYAGSVKYNQKDLRNILERSSARKTAIEVAVGAVAKLVLKTLGISGTSEVTQIGTACCPDKFHQEIDLTKEKGDSVGGKFTVVYKNVPVGLGSFVHWDRGIDGRLAQVLMSIPAIKAVEIGDNPLGVCGSEYHDEFEIKDGEVCRSTKPRRRS